MGLTSIYFLHPRPTESNVKKVDCNGLHGGRENSLDYFDTIVAGVQDLPKIPFKLCFYLYRLKEYSVVMIAYKGYSNECLSKKLASFKPFQNCGAQRRLVIGRPSVRRSTVALKKCAADRNPANHQPQELLDRATIVYMLYGLDRDRPSTHIKSRYITGGNRIA